MSYKKTTKIGKVLTISLEDFCKVSGSDPSDFIIQGLYCNGQKVFPLSEPFSDVLDEFDAICDVRLSHDSRVHGMYYIGTGIRKKESSSMDDASDGRVDEYSIIHPIQKEKAEEVTTERVVISPEIFTKPHEELSPELKRGRHVFDEEYSKVLEHRRRQDAPVNSLPYIFMAGWRCRQ